MPSSDNESSDDETQELTATNVLLGYASKEPTDDSFSQLGGYPVRSDLTYEDLTHNGSTEMASVKESPIPTVGKMQGLSQADGFIAAIEW